MQVRKEVKDITASYITVSVADDKNNDVYEISEVCEDLAVEQALELFKCHHGVCGKLQFDVWEDDNG